MLTTQCLHNALRLHNAYNTMPTQCTAVAQCLQHNAYTMHCGCTMLTTQCLHNALRLHNAYNTMLTQCTAVAQCLQHHAYTMHCGCTMLTQCTAVAQCLQHIFMLDEALFRRVHSFMV